MDKNIGKKLDDRYELLELIGVGGMADIYRAKDIEEDRIVAVKILKNEFAGSEDFLRRFRNESKAIALLSHPNIVKIYDVGFTDHVQFIVMEYIDGITLTDYIEQQGVLKWRDAVHFTMQILRALQHAHDRGIVHRDIKASNIMLLQDGTIKVMDFGIARFNRETDKTMSEKAIGSVHYISPEQARGDITDERSDIYSVGIMMYEMLTGQKPFDGDNPVQIALMHMQTQPKRPTELNTTIPEGLEEIILKAIQKDPARRYQTAGEMVADIEEFKKNPSIVFEYKYFSPDGTTKYFDKVNSLDEVDGDEENSEYDDELDEDSDEDEEDDDEERPSPVLPILFGVASALVIGIVILVVTLIVSTFNKDKNTSSIIDSPYVRDGYFIMQDFVGLTVDDAKEKYGEYVEIIAIPTYNEADKGIIFEQVENEGRQIKIGSQVTVYVSEGLKQIEMENYKNQPYTLVKQQLEKKGFKVTPRYEESDEISKDSVIDTEPTSGSMIPEGSSVTVIVSQGPPNTKIKVINFVGLDSKYRATQRCEELGLIPDFKEMDSTEKEGTVVKQSIPVGDYVEKGTVITLYLSNGKVPETSVDVEFEIPNNVSGNYKFEYYFDGAIVKEDAKRDASIKKFKVSFSGNKKVKLTVKVNIAGGKDSDSVLYASAEIDFTKEKPVVSSIKYEKNAFDKLKAKSTSSTSTPANTTTTPSNTTAAPSVTTPNVDDADGDVTSDEENPATPSVE